MNLKKAIIITDNLNKGASKYWPQYNSKALALLIEAGKEVITARELGVFEPEHKLIG